VSHYYGSVLCTPISVGSYSLAMKECKYYSPYCLCL